MAEPLQSPPDGRGLLQRPFVQRFLRRPWVQRLLRSGEIWKAMAADQDRSAPGPGPEDFAPVTRPTGVLGTLWLGTRQIAQGLWQIAEPLRSLSLRAARTAWALRSKKAFQKALVKHAERTGRQPEYSAGPDSQTRPRTGALASTPSPITPQWADERSYRQPGGSPATASQKKCSAPGMRDGRRPIVRIVCPSR